MSLEVEQKYRVTEDAPLRARLVELGAAFAAPVVQVDAYYNHPSRDFAASDEALRIRRVGERNFVTYKGPKLDRNVKTRRELELPLIDGPAAAASYGEMLTLLGFRPTAVVTKRRSSATLDWNGTRYEVCWDEVDGLGSFLEIELIVDDAGAAEARQRITALEQALGLTNIERRSYLAQVLAARGKSR